MANLIDRDELEDENTELRDENYSLADENSSLKEEMAALKQKAAKLEDDPNFMSYDVKTCSKCGNFESFFDRI